MEATILFTIDVLASFIIWSTLSKKYLWHRVKDLKLKNAVLPILVLHSFRFAGLSFLVPGVVNAGLDPAWAIPAAFGDFAAAVLAFTTLLLADSKWFRSILWIFNVAGLTDLLLAFVNGPRYGIVPFLGAAYFIVILYVPLLLLTHFMVFKLLLKNKKSAPVLPVGVISNKS